MSTIDTKAYYYEKLFKIMTTPPKQSDEIHGVYSPGTVKVHNLDGTPYITLRWTVIPGKMWYSVGVLPGNFHEMKLFAELDFKKTPQTQAWVARQGNNKIFDKGDYYEWEAKYRNPSDWFYDSRLQNKYCEIPDDLLNMASLVVKDIFTSFCGGYGTNHYFDLYMMLQ